MPTDLLLQESFQLRGYRITDLRCCRRAANVLCANALVDGDLGRLVNLQCKLRQAQRVLEHHADGQDSSDRVDDALASDIGGGSCRS